MVGPAGYGLAIYFKSNSTISDAAVARTSTSSSELIAAASPCSSDSPSTSSPARGPVTVNTSPRRSSSPDATERGVPARCTAEMKQGRLVGLLLNVTDCDNLRSFVARRLAADKYHHIPLSDRDLRECRRFEKTFRIQKSDAIVGGCRGRGHRDQRRDTY